MTHWIAAFTEEIIWTVCVSDSIKKIPQTESVVGDWADFYRRQKKGQPNKSNALNQRSKYYTIRERDRVFTFQWTERSVDNLNIDIVHNIKRCIGIQIGAFAFFFTRTLYVIRLMVFSLKKFQSIDKIACVDTVNAFDQLMWDVFTLNSACSKMEWVRNCFYSLFFLLFQLTVMIWVLLWFALFWLSVFLS